jgi:hypothetical protein
VATLPCLGARDDPFLPSSAHSLQTDIEALSTQVNAGKFLVLFVQLNQAGRSSEETFTNKSKKGNTRIISQKTESG